MARLINNPSAYLKKHLTRRSRVLLVNPPVQERRYHWIRWNQPMDGPLDRVRAWTHMLLVDHGVFRMVYVNRHRDSMSLRRSVAADQNARRASSSSSKAGSRKS